jgi:hypothetical protein
MGLYPRSDKYLANSALKSTKLYSVELIKIGNPYSLEICAIFKNILQFEKSIFIYTRKLMRLYLILV